MTIAKDDLIYELACNLTVTADSVYKAQKIGGMTHILFAETRPVCGGSGTHERVVVQRMAFPNECVARVARALMSCYTGDLGCWELSGDKDETPATDEAGNVEPMRRDN